MANQEQAYILNIKGSSDTFQTLIQVQNLIAGNTLELQKLKKEARETEKEFKKLVTESENLAKRSKNVKDELQKVEERMKTLLSTNKQASKEYKQLKERKAELVAQDQKLTKAIDNNNKSMERQRDIYNKNITAATLLSKENAKLKIQQQDLGRQTRQQAKDFEFLQKSMIGQAPHIIKLERSYAELRKQIRGLTEDQFNSQFGKNLIAQAQRTKAELDRVNRSFGDFKSTIGDYDGAINRAGRGLVSFGRQAIGALGVGGAAYIGIQTLKSGVKTIAEFEFGLDKLSSITGVVGDDLEKLGNAAIRISGNFGTASTEILRAFQLVGSQSPKLLKDIQGLTTVAESADILSKASGDSLDDSVKALTLTMAQFNLEAARAPEIVDVLATAAQKGATEIPDITSALEGVGNTANIVGQEFDEAVAAVEAFGAAGLKGNDVGIKYRNILISLAKSGRQEFNPAIHSMADVLDALSKEITTVEAAVGLFKRENADAALALINHRDVVRDLTGNLNDHGNAMRQAITNTENMIGNTKRLSNEWNNLILSVDKGDGVVGKLFGTFTSSLSDILNGLSQGGDGIKEFVNEIFAASARLTTLPLLAIDAFFGGDEARRQERINKRVKEFEDKINFEKDYITEIENGIPVIKRRQEVELTEFQKLNKQHEIRIKLQKEEERLNILENLSVDALQERRIQLYAEQPKGTRTSKVIADEIHELDKLIKEKMGRDGTSTKTIEDFAVNTVGFLQFKIQELNEVLKNTTDETVIANTTRQIVALEKQLESLNEKLVEARRTAEGVPGIANTIPTLATSKNITQGGLEAIAQETQITQLERANERILEIMRHHEKQKQIVVDEGNKARIELNDQFHALEIEGQLQAAEAITGVLGILGNNLTGLFSKNAEEQRQAHKQLLLDFLDFIEAQVSALLFLAATRAALLATGNPVLTVKNAIELGIKTAIVKLGFAAIKALISNFEGGGKVEAHHGVPYTRSGTKDNRLVHVGVGEAIINEQQQQKIKQLGGQNIFAEAGVKGFRNAATNNVIRISNNNAVTAALNAQTIGELKRELQDGVAMGVIQSLTGNREYERFKLLRGL